MARPRKPTHMLRLSGQLDRRPARYADRRNEPAITDPIGSAPDNLSPAETAVWGELSGYGVWLTAGDRLILEIAVRLFHQFRTGDGRNASKLITALSKLGFSPTDRSKVGAPGSRDEPVDPFAEFG
ncbi:hypothetical protein [Devosia salina]|uniref:Uncharacterized protein n=1 Tax=Devosia salina TaxID=2860336 RepID=A0ABX8WBJ1_9HYPH|nr:hypothetical protein [Devosia salina]QYO75331.1 hypothetical protein K1X15_11790 [Devosia salina]